MTSCAKQQQALDRAADFIYLNCNPTLHNEKKKILAQRKRLVIIPALSSSQTAAMPFGLLYCASLQDHAPISQERDGRDPCSWPRCPSGGCACLCPASRAAAALPGPARPLPARWDAGAAHTSPGTIRAAALPRDPPAGCPPRLTWQTWGPPARHPSSAGTCFPRSGAASAEGTGR